MTFADCVSTLWFVVAASGYFCEESEAFWPHPLA